MGKSLKGRELGTGLVQQKDGYYAARYVDKAGKRRVRRFKKLREAQKWLADVKYINEHSNIMNASEISVDAWFDYWIDIKKRTVRPNTVRNYSERYNRNIKDLIGDMLVVDIKPIHCQNIFTKMGDEGYKTSTIYQTRITLFNLLEFAKENDIIINNPCKKSVKSNIGKPSDKKEALTVETQRQFLAACCNNSYENQFRFLLQTGLRAGELIGLRWSDVNFDDKTITVSRSMEYRYSVGEWRVGPPKSSSGYRTIPLTDEAIRILKLQKEKNKHISYVPKEWIDCVFLCRKGTPLKNSTYDAALFKICKKAGIKKFSMHVLRHTFATRCIEGGMTPKTLQKILGHSNISITMNLYVHVTEETKLKEIGLVADALNAV